jgi:uncharacterized membrane protein YhaH (DUF805 family)
MFGLGFPELIIFVIIGIIIVLPNWKIFSKAGFSGWWSLLMIVPFIAVILEYYLAFAEWPIHRELLILKKQQGKEQL